MGQPIALLPESNLPGLHLTHPEPEEIIAIAKLTSDAWKDALTVPLYLEESQYLMTVPLAKDGGMTQWILVDRNLPANQRPLLASCESFRKRSLISDIYGNVTEGVTNSVASVYCDPKYRGRGYATHLMKELAKTLHHWQTETHQCVASVLFSDIGKKFYAGVGWHPFPSYHIEFEASSYDSTGATKIGAEDLASLCLEDEAMVRKAMACPSGSGKSRYTILPDHEHMMWHHSKEEWVCDKLFGKWPLVKGAITGGPGSRVWVVWAHRFYSPPHGLSCSDNTLYILRVVVEDQTSLKHFMLLGKNQSGQAKCEELIVNMRAALQAARNEAVEWKLYHVRLWGPAPEVEKVIKLTGVPHRKVDREEEGICSLLWYGEGSGLEDEVDWLGNEKYGWC